MVGSLQPPVRPKCRPLPSVSLWALRDEKALLELGCSWSSSSSLGVPAGLSSSKTKAPASSGLVRQHPYPFSPTQLLPKNLTTCRQLAFLGAWEVSGGCAPRNSLAERKSEFYERLQQLGCWNYTEMIMIFRGIECFPFQVGAVSIMRRFTGKRIPTLPAATIPAGR